MKRTMILVLSMTGFLFLWSCEATEPDNSAEIENTLLRLIEADDSTFSIEGMDNADDIDFMLGKNTDQVEFSAQDQLMLRDSLYIWRFGRSNMDRNREITIDVETDTSAEATIIYTITGTFHVHQYERNLTSDSSWERGDSVRFSEKPIDMSIERRVQFRLVERPGHGEHWRVTAFTPAYGSSSGSDLAIARMEWVVGDSLITLEDFGNTFIGRPLNLEFGVEDLNQINVYVTNNILDENEAVIGKMHHHPRLDGPRMRRHVRFEYQGSNDSGEKLYSRQVNAPNHPGRRLNSTLHVTDLRTLFDHDYLQYDAASLSVSYWLRRHVHHDRP